MIEWENAQGHVAVDVHERFGDGDVFALGVLFHDARLMDCLDERRRAAVHVGYLLRLYLHAAVVDMHTVECGHDVLDRIDAVLSVSYRGAAGEVDDIIDIRENFRPGSEIGTDETDSVVFGSRVERQLRGNPGVQADTRYRDAFTDSMLHFHSAL